jgi:superfamily I DNA and/or RNA helicase
MAADFADLKSTLDSVKDSLILDSSQIDAFCSAFTRKISLIQGPPGTGKSYVGVQIIQGLLRNLLPNMTPILCVCYTNHALDQFLEALIESGIPASDIVRVGGRSKSIILADRNLRVLSDSKDDRVHIKGMGALYEQAEKEESNLENIIGSSTKGFFGWLMRNHFEEYSGIYGNIEKGFEVVKDHFKQRYHSWKKGKKERAQEEEEEEKGKDEEEEEEEEDSKEMQGIEENNYAQNIWSMSMKDRLELNETWLKEFEESKHRNMESLIQRVEILSSSAKEIDLARDMHILKRAKIIGMTTTGCAKSQELLKSLGPKIVLCEEAGEVLESHLLSCLSSSTELLIMIGDHYQLRPILQNYNLTVDSGNRFCLDMSTFERLVLERQEFVSNHRKKQLEKIEIKEHTLSNIDPESYRIMNEKGYLITLSTQWRMHPKISSLIRSYFYPNLLDAPAVSKYPPVKGICENLWFFDHDFPESTRGDDISESLHSSSFSNVFEAELIVELVKYFIHQGYSNKQIAVLTPYLGQLMLIRRNLRSKNILLTVDEKDLEALEEIDEDEQDENENKEEKEDPKEKIQKKKAVQAAFNECIMLSTVDNFQGREADQFSICCGCED